MSHAATGTWQHPAHRAHCCPHTCRWDGLTLGQAAINFVTCFLGGVLHAAQTQHALHCRCCCASMGRAMCHVLKESLSHSSWSLVLCVMCVHAQALHYRLFQAVWSGDQDGVRELTGYKEPGAEEPKVHTCHTSTCHTST